MTHANDTHPDPTDAPGLISDVVQHFKRLIDSEVSLAKREMHRNLSRAGAGLVMIAIAALLALTALDVLAAAAVAGLTSAGLPIWGASLAVAVVALLVAAVLIRIGATRLNPKNLTPARSFQNVRKDIQTIKEKAHV